MKTIVCKFLLILLFVSCNQTNDNTSNDKQIKLKTNMEVIEQQGVITKVSTKNFEETYNSLKETIADNPNLKIIAELDHQGNSTSVGLKLNPTRIIMFGNPKLGTPLMQSSQTTGLDLPQKIMVWQDDQDMVKVSYNNPEYLKQRHGIEEKDEVLEKISEALNKITNVAIGL
ncbi:DUF302 domain-containing protein [Aquimarina sp. MMG016]|uniref:DUF302 domain-containing protein n=1 Tax=Aquimarina sp. MMG016 TaxID=2822690 RepID=UPI001B3A639D|nr:DUF302 domain-containing protein [Aquimarina sp. MMG016]MBQ4818498.1 DUF302 domain-containing protein [Aquimarina sp. MMG016]